MSRAFKNLIMFKATIPYEFRLKENDYIFTTNVKLDNKLEQKLRRFIIHRENIFIENQKVPSTNSNFSKFNVQEMTHSYFISNIEIQLEIFDNEVKEIQEYYKDNNSILKLSSIFQNILLVFSHIYNETLSGLEFFKPVADYYGPFVSALYLNKAEESSQCIIAGSYDLEKINSGTILNIEKTKPTQWRLFFNRAKNSYNLYDNLDSILSCAISLESYVISLIRDNKLEELFEIYKSGKTQISFFQEVKFLKVNNIIDNVKQKNMNETFSKFKDYRNSIVHGDLESPFISREAASDCINALIDFYNKFELKNIS